MQRVPWWIDYIYTLSRKIIIGVKERFCSAAKSKRAWSQTVAVILRRDDSWKKTAPLTTVWHLCRRKYHQRSVEEKENWCVKVTFHARIWLRGFFKITTAKCDNKTTQFREINRTATETLKVTGSRPSDHYFRSVCLSVCLCRVFLSRLWSDFDQTRTHVICLCLVVSPRI